MNQKYRRLVVGSKSTCSLTSARQKSRWWAFSMLGIPLNQSLSMGGCGDAKPRGLLNYQTGLITLKRYTGKARVGSSFYGGLVILMCAAGSWGCFISLLSSILFFTVDSSGAASLQRMHRGSITCSKRPAPSQY